MTTINTKVQIFRITWKGSRLDEDVVYRGNLVKEFLSGRRTVRVRFGAYYGVIDLTAVAKIIDLGDFVGSKND